MPRYFPKVKKLIIFLAKELEFLKITKTPDQIFFKDYVWTWYDLLKGSGRVTERTLLGLQGSYQLLSVFFFW